MTRQEAINILLDHFSAGFVRTIEDALKQEQGEPVAYFNPQGGFYWAKPTKVETPITVNVEPLPLYTKPQTKGCDECGVGGGYALYCLACAEKFAKLIEEKEPTDAVRYQWLRNEFAHGRETYLAEGIPSGEELDKYIDEQLRNAQ